MKKKVVVFTGAGISAESGLSTFRDSSGLWGIYNIEDVATPDAFSRNPKIVLDFYNIRRRQLLKCKPNIAHYSINKLINKFDLSIITQNIDDLHERSGALDVLHLHGKLIESKSIIDGKVYQISGEQLNLGDCCPKGGQLRPNVVWFGEQVPNMEIATNMVEKAHIFIIIGTSLNVYPAASLVNYAINARRIILVDPNPVTNETNINFELISKKATKGVPELVTDLLDV